ncbi:MAG: hypothetical protein JOY77_01650 [Alphaproteobacteria bacterium]|nr:hypothetical protein [Alphaproteobacteria bacterium]MBV9061616.1 hypothetical protein [Alphaproteobacteria bacterium]
MSSQHEPGQYEGANMNEGNSRGSRVKGQISELAQSAKSQASAAIQPIANNARSIAEEQKQRGAARIDEVARAIHSAAEELAREIPAAGNYIHTAADKLDHASRMLREKSVDELVQSASEFAEEKPFIFVGGAVAVGFLLTRLLRSSPNAADEESDET